MPYRDPRWGALLRPLLLSLLMSGLVAFVAIVRVTKASLAVAVRFAGWGSAWIVASPALLLAHPIVNRAVKPLTAPVCKRHSQG